MDKYLLELLKEIKTIIIPGLGALTLTDPVKGEILFMPYLKFDDGKLASHIAEREGMSVQDATNLIAKYVREIEATMNRGENYSMYQFGSFVKKADGEISFENWTSNNAEEDSVRDEPSLTTEEPEIVPSASALTEETVSVQKTYEAEESYSEEDQWNDDLDLPPINHTYERPKQPILEKTKKDSSKKKTGLIIGSLTLLLLIGGTLFYAVFYNSTERTIHQLSATIDKKKTKVETTESKTKVETETISDSSSKIQESEPIETNIEVETIVPATSNEENTSELRKYHIIMGAFRSQQNAENYVNSLNSQGATATIVTQMDGLWLVSFGSYSSSDERRPNIDAARQINPKAWLMIFP